MSYGYISVKKFDGRTRYLKCSISKNVSQPSKNKEADYQILEENNIDNKIKDNICPSNNGQDTLSTIEEQLADDFEKIWNNYPRKEGKNTAFKHYKVWLKGRTFAGKKQKLTNKEMWYAVKIYAYECERDNVKKQYIKMGSTFFNETIAEKVKRYNDFPIEWEKTLKEWSEKIR